MNFRRGTLEAEGVGEEEVGLVGRTQGCLRVSS